MDMEEDRETLLMCDARYLLESFENHIGEAIVNFDYRSGENEAMARAMSNKFAELFDVISKAKTNIGRLDIRQIDNTDLIKSVNQFIDEAREYDNSKNEKNAKVSLDILSKNVKALENVLNLDWNAKLNKQRRSWKHKPESPHIKPSPGKSDVVIFHDAGVESKSYNECSDCPNIVPFSCAKAFRKHMRLQHNKDVTVNIPKVLCRLPHLSGSNRVRDLHPKDYMATHLLQVNMPTINQTFNYLLYSL